MCIGTDGISMVEMNEFDRNQLDRVLRQTIKLKLCVCDYKYNCYDVR